MAHRAWLFGRLQLCRLAMTTLLTETALFWRGGWPTPYCAALGKRGEHGFDSYGTYYVCAHCGSRVLAEDTMALEHWWQNFHLHSLVYQRN